MTVPRLILASQSRARLWLLESAGFEADPLPSGVDEPDLAGFPDLEAALVYLSELKARAVWRRGAVGLIIAADTVTRFVSADGQTELLGKPADRADAERMLRLLSGSTHDVLTGWRILRTSDGLTLGGVELTRITMRCWTEGELAGYLASGEWEGRCGAYGIQDPDPYITHVAGSWTNVAGLPMERVGPALALMTGT
jgi:septum formation protein